jgi:hypothetical protein
MIMDYPGYQTAFGYLRNVGIDQHVVARSRLPDLADSIITRYPNLLGISEDEGTAWVIRGDTGRIIGRSKAFAYNGAGDASDPRKSVRHALAGRLVRPQCAPHHQARQRSLANSDQPHYVDVRELQ